MNQTLERLHDIEKNGYKIDFGDVFNHAFENYKKIALYAGSVLVIFIVLFLILTSVSLVSVLGVNEMKELTPEKFKIENLSQSAQMALGIFSIFTSCLLSPFFASFLKMADRGEKDLEFPVSSLFSYYKFPYLKEILVSTFIISVISFAQSTLFVYLKLEILGSLINYFISFITLLTVPLIIFGNLQAIDAIRYSIKIVFKEPVVILGLAVVALIGVFVGIMGCCVGIFFTMPFIYSMHYAIYSAIVGIDDTSKMNTNNYSNT